MVPVSTLPFYDALAADYDRFVNWPARLKGELPFLERLFAERGVRRVLDAACGTGQHAIALARRGYQVVGADSSAAMIEQDRRNAAVAEVEATFVVAGLGGMAALDGGFDAVLCLGNSLPHLLSAPAVSQALADFAAVLRPGGLLIIQNRNLDRVWATRERFLPLQSHREGDSEWLFVRFYDFHQETITFNMVCLRRTGEGWTQDVAATELRPIFHAELAAALTAARFSDVAFYGDYEGSAFDPAQSGDLIAVARRAG